MPVDVPEICRSLCAERIDDALAKQKGEWDYYLRDEPLPGGPIEFSHDSVAISGIKANNRSYSIVDQLYTKNHLWIEIGETTYTFDCPND